MGLYKLASNHFLLSIKSNYTWLYLSIIISDTSNVMCVCTFCFIAKCLFMMNSNYTVKKKHHIWTYIHSGFSNQYYLITGMDLINLCFYDFFSVVFNYFLILEANQLIKSNQTISGSAILLIKRIKSNM